MEIVIGVIIIIAAGILLASLIKAIFRGMGQGARIAARNPWKVVIIGAILAFIVMQLNSNGHHWGRPIAAETTQATP